MATTVELYSFSLLCLAIPRFVVCLQDRVACFCRFCERSQALIHGDLHTGSVMVTRNSTQVIDPEFAFYGPMGFDIGAFLGNLILAFFAQNGHADKSNDRKVRPCYLNAFTFFICFLYTNIL